MGQKQVGVGPVPETTTRVGGDSRAPQRLMQAMSTAILWATAQAPLANATVQAVEGEIFCQQALFPAADSTQEHPLLAYGATHNPDTLYYHEAMAAPDAERFKVAMTKEYDDQYNNENFVYLDRSQVPEGEPVLPCVWAMRRKRKTLTGEIYKWKARANLDGSKQSGPHFDHTYAPVATWTSIRLLLTLALQHNWHTVQLDFVQAYPQAPISKVQYMEIPKGVRIPGVDPKQTVLEVRKNIYGGKDAGKQWYEHLVAKLIKIGFVPSKVDNCVFYKGKAMYVLYTDDSILAGPDKQELDDIVKQIQDPDQGGLDITVEGDISDFLGVHIHRDHENNQFVLSQPKLIDSILEELHLLPENAESPPKIRSTPAPASKLLSRHPNSEPFDGSFDMRRIIGKLNYLEKSTRGETAYAVHQASRFVSDPKVEHGHAVRWLARYLLGTRDKGYVIKNDPTRGLEVYVDADWAGNFDPEIAGEDIDTAKSRHGYVIMYAGAPIVWQSQIQDVISLSSCESELVGLSAALRTTIPILEMLKEMKEQGFVVHSDKNTFHCKVFEDNTGAIALSSVPKIRPRTRHINVRYFHFMSYTTPSTQGGTPEIQVCKIGTDDQPADTLTKPNNEATLLKHRLFIWGW